jgi:cyclopropane fatty-acyl-phospholipid synthase-like methyltransferase
MSVRPSRIPAVLRRGTPTPPALVARNRELYDDTFGTVWQRAVFDGMHKGREFINLGGDDLVRRVGLAVHLRADSRVLELCSGPGAVAARLLDLYGCRVTGIDINPRQVAHATAMARRRGAARLDFIEADACTWTAPDRFDAVVSIDAFMLLADPAGALCVARQALRPGGRLAVATLAAGPDMSPECRRFAAGVDGMVNLASGGSYEQWAEAAGFANVRIDEITVDAIEASRRMLDSIRRARQVIVTAQGRAEYRGWVRVSKRYLEAFREGELHYIVMSGLA